MTRGTWDEVASEERNRSTEPNDEIFHFLFVFKVILTCHFTENAEKLPTLSSAISFIATRWTFYATP